MAAAFPRDGIRDLRARLRFAWVWAVRFRVRRSLFQTEGELGWLAWEQVDFFDEESVAAVRQIQEFEDTQAALENTSAELASRKAALDVKLAREKALHDQLQASLAAERAPIATELQQAETARRQKLEAVERFDRAIAEISSLEKELEAHSRAFMKVERPDIEIRTEARRISDELALLPAQRQLVVADKTNAENEATRLEAEIVRLRSELQRIDSAGAAARDTFSETTRGITAERRVLDREKKKSSLHMSHLDRKKQQPYRFIGACLADHGIAPLNQPAVLSKVFALRERDLQLTETLAELRATCAATHPALLIPFYLLLAALLFALFVLASHIHY
jgi:hypothetical protein